MTKFFIILLIIVFAAVVVATFVLRTVRKFFSAMGVTPTDNIKSQKKNEDILYNKDDIVVLKGEADKNKK